MRSRLLSLVIVLAACAPSGGGQTASEREPSTQSPGPAENGTRILDGDPRVKAGYRRHRLHGFEVLLSDQVASHAAEAQAVLARVDASLADAVQRFGPERTARMAEVRIWVEWGDPQKAPRGPAEFHQSKDWLAQHGYDIEKEHGIEINDARVFLQATATQQPFALLHEFAHAYDALVFQNANPAVTRAYRAALASSRYDAVARIGESASRRAYALTDEREYFAEASEAYLGINDFYPFVREDLESADPVGFALMSEVWGPQPKRAALAMTGCEAARSTAAGPPSVIVFRNGGSQPVDVAWLDGEGARKPMRQVAPGTVQAQATYVGHAFELAAGPRCLGLARATPGVVEVRLP